METIAHSDLIHHPAEILTRVQTGESFEITDQGKTIAVLQPPKPSRLEQLRQSGRVREAQPLDFTNLKRTPGVNTQELLADLRADR
ncbi:MAG: type II toxin-antitoxin system prevent-host-death family antitoxin [Actinomycetaceae bacterium]|nr:type II toxin-antitoxin system prevent-host-death family antitoxin [Actinomycetaceae bacterium]